MFPKGFIQKVGLVFPFEYEFPVEVHKDRGGNVQVIYVPAALTPERRKITVLLFIKPWLM
jgi:hypothetical protein